MPESESEDEILERIESALRRISAVAHATKPVAAGGLNHAALVQSLDMIIARLRAGLEASNPAEPGLE